MKSFLYIILTTLLCLFGISNDKTKTKIYILNKDVSDGDTLNVIMSNRSEEKYYLPIDYYYKSIKDRKSRDSFYPNFIITDENQDTIKRYVIDVTPNTFKMFKKSINTMEKISDFTLINSKSEKLLKFKFELSENTSLDYSCQYQSYHLEEKTISKHKFYVQMIYTIDSNMIKREILKVTRDSLKRKGYKCFHGKLITNKIPLKLKL